MQQGLEEQHQGATSNELAISQDSLAQLIHSSRQTVKILQSLQTDKVIALRYGKIIVLDRSILDELGKI